MRFVIPFFFFFENSLRCAMNLFFRLGCDAKKKKKKRMFTEGCCRKEEQRVAIPNPFFFLHMFHGYSTAVIVMLTVATNGR
jgi:hypothetical protein